MSVDIEHRTIFDQKYDGLPEVMPARRLKIYADEGGTFTIVQQTMYDAGGVVTEIITLGRDAIAALSQEARDTA